MARTCANDRYHDVSLYFLFWVLVYNTNTTLGAGVYYWNGSKIDNIIGDIDNIIGNF
jgi:hypothetical protein